MEAAYNNGVWLNLTFASPRNVPNPMYRHRRASSHLGKCHLRFPGPRSPDRRIANPYSPRAQFGFDGGSQWKQRRDSLFATLHSNPKAKFVTRAVQFGSEPLLDGVLSPSDLVSQVRSAQDQLASLGIPVTVSDMQYSFQKDGGSGLKVLDAVDVFDAHMLPFFSGDATTGAFLVFGGYQSREILTRSASSQTARAAWPSIKNGIDKFWVPQANGRKIYLTEVRHPPLLQYTYLYADAACARRTGGRPP